VSHSLVTLLTPSIPLNLSQPPSLRQSGDPHSSSAPYGNSLSFDRHSTTNNPTTSQSAQRSKFAISLFASSGELLYSSESGRVISSAITQAALFFTAFPVHGIGEPTTRTPGAPAVLDALSGFKKCSQVAASSLLFFSSLSLSLYIYIHTYSLSHKGSPHHLIRSHFQFHFHVLFQSISAIYLFSLLLLSSSSSLSPFSPSIPLFLAHRA
jgi:hypothetical protein